MNKTAQYLEDMKSGDPAIRTNTPLADGFEGGFDGLGARCSSAKRCVIWSFRRFLYRGDPSDRYGKPGKPR